jgi:hypothetical protein
LDPARYAEAEGAFLRMAAGLVRHVEIVNPALVAGGA